MSRVATGILALLAFVALLILQFNLPWANVHQSGFGADSDRTGRTWGEDRSGSAFGFSGSDSRGWFDNGWDDADQNAVDQLRIAAPLLVGAVTLLLVGAILALAMPGGTGAIVTLIGGILAAASTALYFIALDDLFNGDQQWQAGFYVAITGCVLGLIGGILGLAMGNSSRQLA